MDDRELADALLKLVRTKGFYSIVSHPFWNSNGDQWRVLFYGDRETAEDCTLASAVAAALEKMKGSPDAH